MITVVRPILLALIASHPSVIHALSIVDKKLDEIIKYSDLIGIYKNVSVSKDELTQKYIYTAEQPMLIIKGTYQNNISICALTDIDFFSVYDKYLFFLHSKKNFVSSEKNNGICDFNISTTEQNAYPIDSYNYKDESGIILIARKSGLNSAISNYDLFIESTDVYIGIDLKETVSMIQKIYSEQSKESRNE